jgi:DNA polymerase III subunit beta
MRLQVTQENLARALALVGRVANGRNALPVLANVLIKTVDNRLSIAATNLEIGITQRIGAKVEAEGAITVPARLMQEFISSLPSGVINLELTDNKLHITTDKYKSTINGVPAEEFPVMPAIQDGVSLTLGAKDMRKALQQVIFAASGDEARPVLTGVLVNSTKEALYLAATDSYRLAEKKLAGVGEEATLLVPSSALNDLLRILADAQEDVLVTNDGQQARFEVDEVELVTRLIEGKYPDYQKLIPTEFSTTAVLSREDFINITKVSSLFARESAGSVTLQVSEKDQSISIRSIASQLGENNSTASAKVTGEGEVTLNSRYLLDALNAFDTEDISFSFNGKLEPCVLKSEKAPDYTHIVMPLRS